MKWHNIPGFPGYQISESGKARTVRGHELAHYGRRDRGYYLYRDGERVRIPAAELLKLALAATEAAPAKLIPQAAVSLEKRRARAARQRQGEKQADARHNPNMRKCATCGKPTVNYRCDACWKKIRGFGLYDERMSVYGE